MKESTLPLFLPVIDMLKNEPMHEINRNSQVSDLYGGSHRFSAIDISPIT